MPMSIFIKTISAKTLFILLFVSCGWAQNESNISPDIIPSQGKPDGRNPNPSNIPLCTSSTIENDTLNSINLNYDEPETYNLIWVEPTPKKTPKQYHVYNCNDKGVIYRNNANKNNCIFVVSKREFRIYVYEIVNNDTLLVAHFPVCLARNPQLADKTRSGDGTTPHCAKDNKGNYIPFTISEIAQSSTWKHDFKDGRGNILAYGDYFMRLQLNGHRCSSNRSIGIHGSTNNELSVPGLDSEGCIRLRNNDLIQLHKYAKIGTKVIIKPKDALKLPFEVRAQEKCVGYQPASRGYTNPQFQFIIINK